MLNTERFKKFNRLGHQVSVEFKESVVEKRCEIFWHLIAFLKTRSESIRQRSNIRNVLVLVDLGLVIHITFKFSIPVLIQKPFKDCLLDLLIVLVLEEFVREKLD